MKPSALSRCILALLLLALLANPAARAQEAPLQGFDEYVNQALKDWDVPGVGIAIVKNDKVVLAKGYGVKKLGEPAPVTEKTMFAIGSASKAFTAAALAMLVDEGKIKWDDPATKYLPGLEMFDPYVTRELTVRDLLSHRSGLERGDLLWYGSINDRDHIVRQLRHLRPSWGFRAQFGYQNLMYVAAGQVIAAVAGKSWDDFVKQRIFSPLGMANSNTTIRDLKPLPDVSTPHARLAGKVEPINWRNIDNAGAAGSINSSVAEMANWVRLQLNEGKFNNQQLISSGSVKEMHMSQTVMRLEGVTEKLYPESHFLNYGLGWFLQDYRGRKIVHHGGNIDGMSALVAMLPEEELGVVILTNMNATMLPTALMYKVFDSFLQAPARDWSAELLKVYKAQMAQVEGIEKKLEAERVKDTRPSLSPEKYAGTYANDFYGEATVRQENGKLVVQYGQAFVGDLEHWHFDTFRATMRDRMAGRMLVTFDLDAGGKVEEMKFNLPMQSPIVFKRAPEKVVAPAGAALSEAEMKKYIGRYESKAPPLEMSIEMIGGQLKGVIPGQPVATLVPVGPNRFKVVVEGAPVEIFAQFEVDGARAKSLTIEQGGMKLTFLLKP